MSTLAELAQDLARHAGTSWSTHTGPQFAALTPARTGRGFAANIVVTEGPGSEVVLDAATTAVVLGQTESDEGRVAAHQVLVDGAMDATVAHEIVWLRGDDGMVRVVASAAAADVSELASLMQSWLQDLNTRGDNA